MNSNICENCGSNLTNEDGVLTCHACGTRYTTDVSKVKSRADIKIQEELGTKTEELRKREIEKILKLQKMGKKLSEMGYYSHSPVDRFNPSCLTEEDILKYAPYSLAAYNIRIQKGQIKKKGMFEDKHNYFKKYVDYDMNYWKCYIATSVYGSYDCPEVLILRQFRDQKLKKTLIGRLFIRMYYVISPTIVKYFGNTKIFKIVFKKLLDKIVKYIELKMKKLG